MSNSSKRLSGLTRAKRQDSSIGNGAQQDNWMFDFSYKPRRTLRDSVSSIAIAATAAVLCMSGVIDSATSLRAEPGAAAQADATGQGSGDYRLGIRDKVKLQVYEWRPARDEVFTWTAINQVYTVDVSGNLTVPLIGQVAAAGYTTSELASLISRRLANSLNLGTVPDTTVEITEFRPIFVAGHVERAGEYSFAPGMTVLQAISLGGGLYRNAANNGMRLEREFLTVAGEYDRQMQERERLMVRKSRLEAELAFSDAIAFPADVRTDRAEKQVAYMASLMSKERSVFELRRKAYDTQVKTLDQLKSFLENEVETLGKRLESHQTQIDLMKSELGGIKNLTDKGLATQPRLLGMLRNLAQLEGEKLRMESDRTRARQEVSRAELSRIEFENRRENELTVELQQVESRLEQVIQEAQVSEKLLIDTQTQAVSSSPMKLVSTHDSKSEKGNSTRVSYTLIRQIGKETIELDATENTPLLPGDTIKVAVSVPSVTGVGTGPLEIFTPFMQQPGATQAKATEGLSGQPQQAEVQPVSDGKTAAR